MPDIHVPKLDGHGGGKSIFKLILEVSLIGVGVFLGLAGEQWRERAHQRELAEQSLRRFKLEITANRKAIADVKDYHAERLKELTVYFKTKPADRGKVAVRITRGLNPAFIEHSAWDLAIATQSLGYIDADLGVLLSSIYNNQQAYLAEGSAFLQAMFINPPTINGDTFLADMLTFYSDAELFEPRLIRLYDDAVQRIDKTLSR